MKPRIFIGSSTEGLSNALIVKNSLSDIADCQIWNEDFFESNRSSLESLNEGALLFDFGILIATKDDLQLKRDNIELIARDNVVFEFGLYVGRLGRDRSFLFKENGLNIPSDLYGVTIPEFAKPSNPGKNSLEKLCDNIKERILDVWQTYTLSFVPSTTLAIGYFENFICQVCRELAQATKREVKGKNFANFQLHIVIPDELPNNFNDQVIAYLSKKNLEKMSVDTNTRSYNFYLDYSLENNEVLHLYDLPTTLSALKKAIEMAIPKSHIGETKRERILKQKEMRNFHSALQYQINENPLTRDCVVIESIDVA